MHCQIRWCSYGAASMSLLEPFVCKSVVWLPDDQSCQITLQFFSASKHFSDHNWSVQNCKCITQNVYKSVYKYNMM